MSPQEKLVWILDHMAQTYAGPGLSVSSFSLEQLPFSILELQHIPTQKSVPAHPIALQSPQFNAQGNFVLTGWSGFHRSPTCLTEEEWKLLKLSDGMNVTCSKSSA